jgi:alkylhydroperoxidase family enzyme
LPSRARALTQLAVTLTAQPWTVTPEMVAAVAREGLDADMLDGVIGVIAMFNYFTRVADATGIELDYQSPLPAFAPDRAQVAAVRPDRVVASGQPGQLRLEQLRAAWESWRSYLLDSDEPITRRDRETLASVAAAESADWTTAEKLGGSGDGNPVLITFARKLTREPWCMTEDDLKDLRAAGYPEPAILHVISVVAHQNASSRLSAGLAAANSTALLSQRHHLTLHPRPAPLWTDRQLLGLLRRI